MSGVFPPGSRPDQWSTLGDHQRRISALEAVPTSSAPPIGGCDLPCPPWTVDYVTGEVVGTTYDTADVFPAPLTLAFTLATGQTAVAEAITMSGDAPANYKARDVDIDINDATLWIDDITVVGATNSGSFFGREALITGGGQITFDKLTGGFNNGESGTLWGTHAAYTSDDQSSITETEVDIVNGDSSSSIGYDVAITGGITDSGFGTSGKGFVANVQVQGDSVVATAAQLASTVTAGTGTPYALLCTAGNVQIGLQTGEVLQVLDSSLAPIFEVREDGSVHILTGGTITADL